MGEARLTFLATLRAGLRGAPAAAVNDVIADYASHFDVGASKGRAEEDIAAALGDPLILADELRVEMRIDRWKTAPSPISAAKLIGAIISFGAINAALAFIMLPLLFLLVFVLLITVIAVFAAGVWLLFAGASFGFSLAASLLAGAGLILAAIALASLLALLVITIVGGLGRYARLHYRLLPRLKQSAGDAP